VGKLKNDSIMFKESFVFIKILRELKNIQYDWSAVDKLLEEMDMKDYTLGKKIERNRPIVNENSDQEELENNQSGAEEKEENGEQGQKDEEINESKVEEFGEEEEFDFEDDSLFCVACNKSFKSSKSFENHEKSKKHKENVELLKKHMNEENSSLLENNESKSEIKNRQSDEEDENKTGQEKQKYVI
jgi:DnaJ family protein A protein 5